MSAYCIGCNNAMAMMINVTLSKGTSLNGCGEQSRRKSLSAARRIVSPRTFYRKRTLSTAMPSWILFSYQKAFVIVDLLPFYYRRSGRFCFTVNTLCVLHTIYANDKRKPFYQYIDCVRFFKFFYLHAQRLSKVFTRVLFMYKWYRMKMLN